MKLPLYQVDAFTSQVFSGNPAAVCILPEWIEDDRMQSIAAENNLSETAFLVRQGDGFELRWFTPLTEVTLCGHATLASAFVLFDRLRWSQRSILFETRWEGRLMVIRQDDLLIMDFPVRPPALQKSPDGLDQALGVKPQAVFGSEEDLLVLLENEQQVRSLEPDVASLARLDCRGVIVTAAGGGCDFVSRFFAPRVGVTEDPVTGSAHCVLVPYWSRKLDKKRLHARQVSRRGGELFCEDRGHRVGISGRAVLYLEGTIWV